MEEKSVVITGASSGIGEACALRLAGLGMRVFAGVRSEADGERLKRQASDRLTPVLIDVTQPETIASASGTVGDAVGPAGVAGLVNNAGVFFGGPLEFASVDEIRRTFDVNVFGAVAVTQAFLPLLRARAGRIVNISSASGLLALPFLGPYAASKFALEALSDSLRAELAPWGIHVAVVEPGHTATRIQEKSRAVLRAAREAYPPEAAELYGWVFGLGESEERVGVPADRVARAVEDALLSPRPRRRYVVGRDARIVSLFRHLPAGWRDWLIAKHLDEHHGRRRSR